MSDEYVAPQELVEQLQSDHPPTLIDVRGAEEYTAGHLPGARHIPGDQLEQRLDEVPRDRPVVPY